MAFDVSADAYGRFMGRYSEPLSLKFADFTGIARGQRAVDVGCGPGALTAVLVSRLGADSVAAVDPSESFVAATRERCPGADVRPGTAEQLPFADGMFTAAVAQLVVHFMADPVAGLREMARVVEPAGTVAACVWNLAGGDSPLSVFWRAVRELDPTAEDESTRAGAREGHLGELFDEAGVTVTDSDTLQVSVHYDSFDEWWEPYTMGVGPAGGYVAKLDDTHREALRVRCAETLPDAPFDIVASAWSVSGRVEA